MVRSGGLTNHPCPATRAPMLGLVARKRSKGLRCAQQFLSRISWRHPPPQRSCALVRFRSEVIGMICSDNPSWLVFFERSGAHQFFQTLQLNSCPCPTTRPIRHQRFFLVSWRVGGDRGGQTAKSEWGFAPEASQTTLVPQSRAPMLWLAARVRSKGARRAPVYLVYM